MSERKTFRISTAPFLREGRSTQRMMWEVLAALLPVAIAAFYHFGVGALLVLGASALGACATEWVAAAKREGLRTLPDGSALLTGLLLGFTMPPAAPLWMAFLGGVVAIALGKWMWGGLGANIFNPALVGRAFLQAAFPATMTTWTKPGLESFSVVNTTLSAPFMNRPIDVDVLSSATPLALFKFAEDPSAIDLPSYVDMLFGNTGGCLGETSAFACLLGAAFLLWRRTFDWRLLVSTLLGVAAFSGALHLLDPSNVHPPLYMLLGGGLMFGAVYMATDPVTTPITTRGAWIFGIGVGFLVVLLRAYGGLPESVMYSILLMNAVTPLINRRTQPRRFGA